MALRDWISKNEFSPVATAKPATPATDRPKKRGSVATVATVAVADPEKQKKEAPAPVDYNAEIDSVIDELNEMHVIVPEMPEEIRRETLILEAEITEASNAGDVERFREALNAWRLAWFRGLH